MQPFVSRITAWKSSGRFEESVLNVPGRPVHSRRGRVAVLAPRVPWPLTDVTAARIFYLLHEASREFDVYLFAFRDAGTEADLRPLVEVCARVVVVERPSRGEPRAKGILPPEVYEFESAAMRRLWSEICRDEGIGLRQVESAALARYPGEVLVEHEVIFRRHAWIYEQTGARSAWWDLYRWRRFEQRAARRFRRTVVGSEEEAALLVGSHSVVIGQGIDLELYRPEPERPGCRVLFAGTTSRTAQAAAGCFLVERIWPRIRQQFPEARLTVIDRHGVGSPEFAETAGVQVVRPEGDLRSYYRDCNVAVVATPFPSDDRYAVLEALAMERAVVATPQGCAGLGLKHGESAWIAGDEDEFAEGVRRLLADPDLRSAVAAGGRGLAESRFDWRAAGARQRRLYESLLPPLVSVRPATPADIPSLSQIQGECAEASHWPPDRYLAYTCRVAVRNGSIAGFLVSRQTAPGEREILNLAVSRAHRRCGVAMALLRVEIESSPGEFFLEVRESNLGAQNLYRQVGFEDAGRRPQYYDDPPETAVVMRLQS